MMMSPPSRSGVVLLPPTQETESKLSSLIYDMSQQVQGAMENLLKSISEIDENSVGIMEGMEKSKNSASERMKVLEEEKEGFRKLVFTVLETLNNKD